MLNSAPVQDVSVGRKWWKRVLAGLAALLSGQVISILGTVAVVPIYLTKWPVDRYGEWLALSSLVAYLSALDLGMNMGGTNKLTQEYARGDMEAYTRLLRSAMAFYLAIASAGSVILAAAVVLLPISRWLGLRVTGVGEAAIVVFLIGMQVLWSMPAGFIGSIYRTTGDLARTQWVRNAQDIAALTFTSVCLIAGGSMIALAIVQLFCLAAPVICVLVDLRKRHPAMVPGLAGAQLSGIRGLVRPSLLFVLIMLATAIAVQGPTLLISAWFGGAAVAVFVSTRTLANLARQIVNTVTHALWPHVTALEAQAQHSRIRVLHRFWVVCSTALCISLAAPLWFEGGDVIRLWTRGRLPPDTVLLRLLLIQIVLQVPWQASTLITAASNQHGRISYAWFWSSVLGLGIAAALLTRLGLWAVPVGSIIGEGLMCYHFVLHDTCERIGEAYWKFASWLWLYLGLASSATLLVAWGAHKVAFGPPPLRWAEVGAATVIGSGALLWAVGLGPADRHRLKSLFQLVNP